ncbi:MAG TPA: LOG family protein [Thermoanaerobaculia bacterium]|nr:LOG family protein [Thermoanaerobaculia bacterium]
MARSTRFLLPEPAAAPRETRGQRWRRKARTKLGRQVDRTILSLYRVISWLERRAPAERRYFRVAIFGSSRIQPQDESYARVKELARRLSYMGCDIVTGGGPGLMSAANEGARDGAYRYRTRSFGLTILLPIEEQPNPFLDEVAHHPTFFSRLHQFIRLSHVYLVMDGGIGTTLEAMMVWQLLQVRLVKDRPLIFVGPMWRGLRAWVESEVVGHGLASPGDLDVAYWVDDIEQALALVETARNDFLRRHEVQLPPPVLEEGPGGGTDQGQRPKQAPAPR